MNQTQIVALLEKAHDKPFDKRRLANARAVAVHRGDAVPLLGPGSEDADEVRAMRRLRRRTKARTGKGGENLEDRVREAVQRTDDGHGRWTLPVGLWTEGIIEDTSFVRNQPLIGDPRVHTMAREDRAAVLARIADPQSTLARARPLLGAEHPQVRQFRALAAARAHVARERVLPDAYANRTPHQQAQLLHEEIGKPHRKHLLPPGASGDAIATRSRADFFSIDQ
jgi:hypothetical protein